MRIVRRDDGAAYGLFWRNGTERDYQDIKRNRIASERGAGGGELSYALEHRGWLLFAGSNGDVFG